MNTSAGTRFLAALLHLGYLPVAFGLAYAIADPPTAPYVLAMAVLYTVLALIAFRHEPKQEFLREHLHEARRYHSWGAVTAMSLLTAAMYVAVFTWGLGALVALCLAPVAILLWMVPTWAASYDALRGHPHQYQVWSHAYMMSLLRGQQRPQLVDQG